MNVKALPVSHIILVVLKDGWFCETLFPYSIGGLLKPV